MAADLISNIFDRSFNWLRSNLGSWLVFFGAMIAGILLWTFFLSVISHLKLHNPNIDVSYLIVILPVTAIWLYRRRIPRFEKNKIGILVGITSEDIEIRKKVAGDLKQLMNLNLQSSLLKNSLELRILSEYHSRTITTNEIAHKFNNVSRAAILLPFDLRLRKDNARDTYSMRLHNTSVRHTALPIQVSQIFGAEIAQTLPSQIKWPIDEEAVGVEGTSELLTVLSKSVIATALLLSNRFDEAETLYSEASAGLDARKQMFAEPRYSEQIQGRIRANLKALYLSQCIEIYTSWLASRSEDDFRRISAPLSKWDAIDPNDHNSSALKAIYYFVIEKDCKKAEMEYLTHSDSNDANCLLGLAFLKAYQENLDKAEKKYDAAFSRTSAPHTYNEVEEFINWIIQKEPNKIQLHFASGLINFYGKNDYGLAIRDMQAFLKGCRRGAFVQQKIRANKLLKEAKKKQKQIENRLKKLEVIV